VKILYVGKHGQLTSSNDDEGAVAHALRQLGHTVECLGEEDGPRLVERGLDKGADLLLFNHWLFNCPQEPEYIRRIRCPKVFWYFDLVDCADETLRARCTFRRQGMARVLPLIDLGFCTDGDWVAEGAARHSLDAGKLLWLPQGFDERQRPAPPEDGSPRACNPRNRQEGAPIPREIPVLFLGAKNRAGRVRRSFVEELRDRYMGRFIHVWHGCHGAELAEAIHRAKIVVAPDGPGTDRYWSNRVYLVTGLGGFLLHPYSAGLTESLCGYRDSREVGFYRSREDLWRLLDYYLQRPDERRQIAEAGRARTLAQHTYRHRVVELLRTVKERLGVG